MIINFERRDRIMRRCDKTMAFSFYASIYFLPIASAFVESFFGIMLCAHLFKRGVFHFYFLKEQKANGIELTVLERVKKFFESFNPASTSLNKPIGFYIIAAFLSVVFSYDHILALKGFVFKLLQAVYIYFLFIECMTTRRRLNIFLSIYLISLTLISTNGIYQYIIREGFIRGIPVTDGRITSSFKHANDFSGYLIIILPLVFSLMIFRQPRGIKIENKLGRFWMRRRGKVLISILFFGALACLGFTYARAAWIAFIISLFGFGLKKPKILVYIIGSIITFLLIFVPLLLLERKSNIMLYSGFQGIFVINERLVYLQEALRVFMAHPINGVGLNNYSLVAPEYKIRWGGYPHNCYLQMMAEIGILGISTFLWIFYRLYKETFKNLNNINSEYAKCVVFGLTMGLTAFMIHSFFDTNFYSNRLGNLMWFIMGFLVAVQKVELALQSESED